MTVSPQLIPYEAVAADVIRALTTDQRQGLSAEQVAKRRQQYGWNQLAEAPAESTWVRLARQFKDLVVLILIGAAIIAGVVGDWTDALPIVAIVLLNGLISFVQEEHAGRSLDSLRKLSIPSARVLRDGMLEQLAARELVPGDIIHLAAGDHVPADARLLESVVTTVQEAALTGESVPVEKEAGYTLPANTPLADRRNMVYQGTIVATGKATAVVTSVGMSTELGQIAGLLERSVSEPTPLQRRLPGCVKYQQSVCFQCHAEPCCWRRCLRGRAIKALRELKIVDLGQ